MRNFFNILFLLLIFNSSLAQVLNPEDIITTSGDYSEGTTLSFSWTLGESMIGITDITKPYVFTQGFQQVYPDEFIISPPKNLVITPVDQQITLTWSPNTGSGIYKYNIYRDISSPVTFLFDSVVGSPPDTFYVDTDLIIGETYYYRITAIDIDGNESDFSNEVSAAIGNLYIDSLALVALYNSTNGPTWTNNINWLTGPVSTWYGITVSGDRVTEISFFTNNLTGTIPPEIGNLTNLTYLYLSENQLTGSILSEIGNLINLTGLSLHHNNFSGSIPAAIGNLINLTYLNLNSNQLTGSIPNEVGNLINLYNLDLSSNQVSGSIPSEIGNLTSLQFLYLNDNLFTDLPDLSSLVSLNDLHIQNNQFTFKDIEPNIGVASTEFIYSPQDSVGQIIDTTVYVGTSFTLSVSTGGASSQYQWKKNGINIGSIYIDSTYTLYPVVLSDSGTYTCEITNTVATDLTLYSRPIHVKATIISSFPYSEDFESGNSGWCAGGINSSWQLGNPAGPTINTTSSGSAAWVTNLTGDYNPDEVSYVTSPRFILSGLNYPKIVFSIWWDAEGFYDGANLQYKQGTGVWKTLGIDEGDDSWYNSSYLYSIEKGFGFDINNSAGWTGDDEWGYGSNGWVTVDHALTNIEDRSDVAFRIAFASNSGYENDGVAIDDINIYDDPTGIDDADVLLSDIQIYPNPNEGTFTLLYNGKRNVDLNLQLINLQGQVILSEQIETGYRFSKEFELDYLPPGIYYFRLIHKEGVVVKKMIVN